ncbi:RNA polymerase I associated factor, A49-like protein [Rhodofomes roseus]|uniref:RNA polymerase I associated factor, A49-like protein n=1 Tax=Rhodofomes roseus TaxID=34475 RepID=A0ABQ8KI88_9APHY|nr:RNA polymerase I associated factor, A49-like protein [Rhodofomes roseus]KAH9837707.1 RNA polymerase I associated factor, A49-like protein [Rhodofomes roseus]
MASASISRKRKRDTDDAGKITLLNSSQSTSHLGPVLASFPALQPPKKTSFRCWRRDKHVDGTEAFASQDTLVAGETETVEFSTSGESQQASVGCSYLVAVHNKRTNTTVFRPAPLHIMNQQVKALKNLAPIEATNEERAQLRNKLGETFGTKKAKAAIRAQERNRVDIDALKGVTGHLQETIMENTSSLPTLEEAKEAADSNRLIPPHNPNADRPDNVYALHDIIPETEFNALSVAPFRSATNVQERKALLPFRQSNWVNQHIYQLFQAPKLRKTDLKIVMYVSAMLAFRMAARSVNDKEALQKKFTGVPQIVVDGLLSRFTESERDTNKIKVTSQTETMLMTYMLALCLRVDDFATDTELIAHDLKMPASKVNPLFKALGCNIRKLDHKDLKRLGLPDSATESKRAILEVPVKFPQPRPKRARR